MPGEHSCFEVGSSELNTGTWCSKRAPPTRCCCCLIVSTRHPRSHQIMPVTTDVKDITRQLISTALDCSRKKDPRSCYFPDELIEEGRFAWGSVGDLIEATPFLPITINVPDMIYGMYEMFHRVMDYFYGSDMDTASTPRIWEILQDVEDALPDI